MSKTTDFKSIFTPYDSITIIIVPIWIDYYIYIVIFHIYMELFLLHCYSFLIFVSNLNIIFRHPQIIHIIFIFTIWRTIQSEFLEYNWNSSTNIHTHTFIFIIIQTDTHTQYNIHTHTVTLKWIYWIPFNLFAFDLLFCVAVMWPGSPFIKMFCLQCQCNDYTHRQLQIISIDIHAHLRTVQWMRLQLNF